MSTHASVPRLLPVLALLALPAVPSRDVLAFAPEPRRDPVPAERHEAGTTPVPVDAAARSAGADGSWWESVSARIEQEEYTARHHTLGLRAPNRAQNLRTYFRKGGIEVLPRVTGDEDPWRFTWQTASWGRPGSVQAVAAGAEPRAQGTRVSYDHAGITEWYENGKAGLEQGFTVDVRPPGAGPLCLTGLLGGTLRAELTDAGELDLFDPRGARALRYAKLEVIDAHGALVDSRMSLRGNELAIVIEDDGAAYPLTVDPLMTSPSWTADADQAIANFGRTVAGAGDVNGDGYSDVIVGAPSYDNGEDGEGKAFVYHGSANGLALTAAWTAEGNQAGAAFGTSVAGAGDVNGDGYSDVIVGAHSYDNGEVNEGKVFVYHGSPGGLALTAG